MRIGLVGFVLVSALSIAASATAAPASRYTSIENKDCKFAPIGNQPGDADDQVKTCPGLGGARVVVNAFHTRLRIGFAWPGKPKVSPVPIVAEAWSAGEKVEWRGTADGKGFVPYAATVRMLFPDEGSAKARYSVLAVMRVKRGEACLVGAVDVGANKDAYDLARALADAAPSFVCGKDKPRIAGAETEWAKMIVADKR
jgi:hypothetical protein